MFSFRESENNNPYLLVSSVLGPIREHIYAITRTLGFLKNHFSWLFTGKYRNIFSLFWEYTTRLLRSSLSLNV